MGFIIRPPDPPPRRVITLVDDTGGGPPVGGGPLLGADDLIVTMNYGGTLRLPGSDFETLAITGALNGLIANANSRLIQVALSGGAPLELNLSDCALPQTQIDAILRLLVNSANQNGVCALSGGTNGAPTQIPDAAVAPGEGEDVPDVILPAAFPAHSVSGAPGQETLRFFVHDDVVGNWWIAFDTGSSAWCIVPDGAGAPSFTTGWSKPGAYSDPSDGEYNAFGFGRTGKQFVSRGMLGLTTGEYHAFVLAARGWLVATN